MLLNLPLPTKRRPGASFFGVYPIIILILIMPSVIRCAKLPLIIDIAAVQHEVASLTADWLPHFNTRHYEGAWTVLPLRSPGGHAEQIVPELFQHQTYMDTYLMAACPSVKHVLDTMQCPLMAVRLLNLHSGSVIKEHRDHDLSFENGEARLHFPVFTNEQVAFYIDGQLLPMHEGECWYMNAQLPHRVANYGPTDRIHLVVDCLVNDWLTELFNRSQVTLASPETNQSHIHQVIESLRVQNTAQSHRLADELEGKLEVRGKR